MIVLLPEKQNKGYGTVALRWIIKEVEKRKYIAIYLHTDLENVMAQRCYAKCGFNICDNVKCSYSNGEENIDGVKMILRLSNP
jgi:RimJ/RimL family protein N-acetyltransferase